LVIIIKIVIIALASFKLRYCRHPHKFTLFGI
jgi:hypothetical protein